MSRGLMVFPSVLAALKHGFQVFDTTPTGYLVRRRYADGWATAIVDLKGEK